MTKIYRAYIDEAGDEGLTKLHLPRTAGGGQSRWLVLGGMIVAEPNNRLTAGWRDDIADSFPNRQRRDIHWHKLKHEQKVLVCQKLAALPLGIGVALSNKTTIPGTSHEAQFSQKGYLYNYLTRWLLERLLSAAKRQAGTDDVLVRPHFSRRAGTDYQQMKAYLTKLREGADVVKSPRLTDWSKLDIQGTRVENHSKSPGLQLADCVTSAFFNGFEPNLYGNTEPRYASILAPRLLNYRHGAVGEGLTLVPSVERSNCTEEQMDLIRKCGKM